MQKLPEKIDSKFRFVLLAAERAERMMRGAKPKVDVDNVKASRIAMKEIAADVVEWDYGPEPDPDEEAIEVE